MALIGMKDESLLVPTDRFTIPPAQAPKNRGAHAHSGQGKEHAEAALDVHEPSREMLNREVSKEEPPAKFFSSSESTEVHPNLMTDLHSNKIFYIVEILLKNSIKIS
jgi:hypothetical protein